jgi:hypothetical protein
MQALVKIFSKIPFSLQRATASAIGVDNNLSAQESTKMSELLRH